MMNNHQRYLETLDFIRNLTTFGINLGLGRIKELLKRLNNPESKIRVVHIGGTNGKGSTCAILQALLMEAGYRVGMFISPHLHDYRERIRINQELISEEDVVACMGEIRPVLEAMLREGLEHPTEFEVSTALALYYFAKKQPDFVIMEVGLGGEIDSTNVVRPLVSVLTSISMDHMDYLGNSLAEIAKVKAGIIKPGIPVVTSAAKAEALQVITEAAQAKGARMVTVVQENRKTGIQENKNSGMQENKNSGMQEHKNAGKQEFRNSEDRIQNLGGCIEHSEVKFENSEGRVGSEWGNGFHYYGLRWNYESLQLGLLGRHQLMNAATALAVCEVLEDSWPGGLKITEEQVRAALRQVRWPARLELLAENPKVLIDGAHNVDGMLALAGALEDYAETRLKRKRLILCVGMLSDKEVRQAMDIIAPLADEIFVTKPDSPRAVNWQEPARFARKYLPQEKIHTIEDPILAVREGLKIVGPEDLLLVTGSLYMIAAVRNYFINSAK